MSAFTTISMEKLLRLIGLLHCPVIIDVRTDDDFNIDPSLIPGSVRRSHENVSEWAQHYIGKSVVVVCYKGEKLAQGTAAMLRIAGIAADTLEGGFSGWTSARLPVVPEAKIPKRDARGRSVWVTRSRPKIDRIACPWLIRRFVDPTAIFLFVAPAEVEAVGVRFNAVPFDIENVFWSHRGDKCTFDVMVEEYGLNFGPLLRLATIVRGADTARPELAPEAPGLLAASLGLSRMYADDLAQLEAGMTLYDAFYRWCRDAIDETHTWPAKKIGP